MHHRIATADVSLCINYGVKTHAVIESISCMRHANNFSFSVANTLFSYYIFPVVDCQLLTRFLVAFFSVVVYQLPTRWFLVIIQVVLCQMLTLCIRVIFFQLLFVCC